MARVHEMEVRVPRFPLRRRALGPRFLGVLLVLYWMALWGGFISAIAPGSTRRGWSPNGLPRGSARERASGATTDK